jgi:hypothetical protein
MDAQRHAPPTQSAPIGHALSHPPQWARSVVVLTHAAPHVVIGAAQLDTHTPPSHLRPSVHTVPQVPQFIGSVIVLTQVAPTPAPHMLIGGAQGMPQTPRTHIRPAAHARGMLAVPQAPQCVAEVRVSVSQPLAASPSQSPKPAAQVGMQRPLAQVFIVVPVLVMHVAPHMPQFIALVCRLTQVGAIAIGVQSVSPVGHILRPLTQAPITHMAPIPHAVPQAPQFIASVDVLTQVPPQLIVGAAHAEKHVTATGIGRSVVVPSPSWP